jgi:putative ABC transport system permease protein
MFKNYINVAFRNLKRQRAYSLINIIGLSVGLMACIVIVLYVQSESSYEKFYPNSENIYRVTTHHETSSGINKIAVTPSKVTEVSLTQVPETALATIVFDWRVGREILTKYQDKTFVETEVFFADSSFFKVFQHQFIDGDPETALDEPNTLVLTAETALKYFNRTDNLIGEVLNANGSDYKVTGVIEDIKGNTALKFDFVFSIATLQRQINNSSWFPMNYFTYITLNENTTPGAYEENLNKVLQDNFGKELEASGTKMFYETQNIVDMHFNTEMGADYPQKVSKNLIYSLMAIAAFILLIACINYVNLSTAKSEKRAKEVGMRKVLGAVKRQLILQFYGETLILTFVSVVLGVVLAEVLLPSFNQIANTSLSISYFDGSNFIPILFGFVIIVSLISGSYPATYLSSFQPVQVLKGTHHVKGGNLFRRVLVVVQFTVSVFLIVGTLIIYFQLDYMQEKDMGYDSDQIVYMKLPDRNARDSYESMKGSFSAITGVEGVTYSNNMISNVMSGWGAIMEGLPKDASLSFRGMNGDLDFLETFGFDLLAGEGFQKKSNWKTEVYYLVNETGIKALGLTPEEAIGKKFGIAEYMMGTITGVIKDFHIASLHTDIEPLAVFTGPQDYKGLMYTRVNMSRMEAVLAEMEQVWEEFNPERAFEPLFVNESIREMYESEQRLGNIILIFTSLAISIGCLGLFGLASYLAEKKTKEIGIRKVLGADMSKIIFMLSKEYVSIILISNLLAWPLAYLAMNNWLSSFEYRIDIAWQYFVVAGLATTMVALLTVSHQSIKAALSNPIKALRYE